MAVNPFVNNINYKPTQDLIEDLNIESIKMYGVDVYYLPRHFREKDLIFGENPLSFFKNHFKIEMFIENFAGLEGEGEIASKFGIEIRENISFTVSKKRFQTEASKINIGDTQRLQEIVAPIMGDLIYLPITKGLFEIKHVDARAVFYQQGKVYTTKIDCELFKYSMENIDTGITEIDKVEDDIISKLNSTDEGNYDMNSKDLSDNSGLQLDASKILDFTDKDPFSEGKY